jgi:signal transduction histidine kinase
VAAATGLLRQILDRRDLIEILNHLPYMALILTEGREVAFANRTLLTTLGLAGFESILTRRPGELLLCLHSSHRGCGGAEGCRHCQAAQTIDEALLSRQKVTREARISARLDGRLVAYDLKVTATPLDIDGQQLAMVFFEDIGAQKRREHLESIFLHDLLNTLSGVQLVAERLQHDPAQVHPVELARLVQLLTDEIRAQQILIEAERGDLQRNILCVPVRTLFEDALVSIRDWSARRGIAIITDLPVEAVYLATDPLVARRVLLNAVKNAVEASTAGESVRIGVTDRSTHVVITVWNAGVMAEHTQHQVFQRSFSTKGEGRGLGTYSMRLLMENYLGGTVGFTSSPEEGTVFSLTFPSMESYLAGAAG